MTILHTRSLEHNKRVRYYNSLIVVYTFPFL